MKETLRNIPLFNSMSTKMPELPQKLTLNPLHLPERYHTLDHFPAWKMQCDKLIQCIHDIKQQQDEWDLWYNENYLIKQPPGMLDINLLSPKKK